MEQRLSLVTIGVSDLERSRRFYEALGWKTGAAPSDDIVFFQLPGLIVALWDRGSLAEDSTVEDSGGWGGITLAHNVGSPAEVDAVIAEAEAAACAAVDPQDDIHASAAYRRALAGTMVERALKRAAARAQQ